MLTKQRLKLLGVALALTCTAAITNAQPGDGGPDPDPGPSTNIPFDGGLSLVVAAGIAYAAKKGVDKRKQKKEKTES